jgi:hypothetical protein
MFAIGCRDRDRIFDFTSFDSDADSDAYPEDFPFSNNIADRAPVVLYTNILFDDGERNERYTGIARRG